MMTTATPASTTGGASGAYVASPIKQRHRSTRHQVEQRREALVAIVHARSGGGQ